MKLVVLVADVARHQKEVDKLSTYKYRGDVIIKDDFDELEYNKIIAAAYANIFVPLVENFAPAALQALMCEVPVIASTQSNLQSWLGDAAVFIDAEEPARIADAMKLVYKDEAQRLKTIENGRNFVSHLPGIAMADAIVAVMDEQVVN